MLKFRKIIAVLLLLTMALGVLAACDQPKVENPDNGTKDTPLVVGYAPFNEKFSPFFSETAYDQDVMSMTALGLLTSDRTGAIILNGIEGETIAYNGTDYTYHGPANLVITENTDGTVYYDFTLREDLKFSDGKAVTIDDVIFSMYVLCDPTYDGSSTLFALPIEGMAAYRAGMDSMFNLIAATKKAGYTATELFTEAQYNYFWEAVDAAGAAMANEILTYIQDLGYEITTIAEAAALWGYAGLAEDATAADFFAAMVANYGYDISDNGLGKEMANTSFTSLIQTALGDKLAEYQSGVSTGESASTITGIQKTGKNTLRVVLTEVDATAIYQLGVVIAPMHYYGNADLYDYENGKFGFTKGDLSSVRAKTTKPMGAGPYKFQKFENGRVYFEANESYFLGAPKTKYVQFQETNEADKLNGILTGTIDITDPSFDKDTVDAITKANGGAVSGNKVTVSTVNNLGYGYLGMSANRVNVGGNIGSEASKNLRKAFATIFSVYRDVSVDTYYGERASVINYPISDTSWAAPRPTDEGYKVAFSVDANGNSIYTSTMTTEEKYAAAKTAALGFFEAAGYTVADGKVTAAPAGAKLEYELWIPADGGGGHPSFMMCTLASEALADLGITLTVKDLANSDELWTALEAEGVDMWCAAWGATVDPDMYQIYFSGDANGNKAGGSNYMYDINDANLNELILNARKSLDTTFRKTLYKQCLDIIVDWAVEVPVYQRQNAITFSTERVKIETVTPDITTFYGWMAEIQNIEMK